MASDERTGEQRAGTGSLTERTRLAVVEDHPASREGIARIIEATPDLEVALTAATGAEALRSLPNRAIDVCLLDLSLPDIDGVELIGRIKELAPTVRVLVFTMHDETTFGVNCLKAGAMGFLSKGAAPSELREAIRCVRRGQVYTSPALSTLMFHRNDADSPLHSRLSAREWAVFIRLAEGHRNSDISRDLHLDQRTVSSYRRRVLDKLGLDSDADLVRYAMEHGLLDDAPGVYSGGNGAVGTHRAGESTGPVSSAVLDRLVDSIPLAAVISDPQGKVTYWSDRATGLFGYTRTEAVGANVGDLLIGIESGSTPSLLMASINAKQAWEGTFRGKRKDQSFVDVRVVIVPVVNDEGLLTGVCGLFADDSIWRSESDTQITRLRSTLESLRRNYDLEASRVAGFLHDDVVVALQGLRTELSLAAEAGEAFPSRLADLVAGAIQRVDRVLVGVERIATRVYPNVAVQEGLANALKMMTYDAIERNASRSGLLVTTDVDSYRGGLIPSAEREVYRVAREAMADAEARGATRIQLILCSNDATASSTSRCEVLEIVDNGALAVDPAPALPTGDASGLSLAMMRHRAARLGASLTVEPVPSRPGAPTSGVRVRLEVPGS